MQRSEAAASPLIVDAISKSIYIFYWTETRVNVSKSRMRRTPRVYLENAALAAQHTHTRKCDLDARTCIRTCMCASVLINHNIFPARINSILSIWSWFLSAILGIVCDCRFRFLSFCVHVIFICSLYFYSIARSPHDTERHSMCVCVCCTSTFDVRNRIVERNRLNALHIRVHTHIRMSGGAIRVCQHVFMCVCIYRDCS